MTHLPSYECFHCSYDLISDFLLEEEWEAVSEEDMEAVSEEWEE